MSGMNQRASFRVRLKKDLSRHWGKYVMFLPVLVILFLFNYKPMYGIVIAFKNYKPARGIVGSQWVGLKHFEAFINDFYFLRVFRNTIVIALKTLLWGFPAPVILALLMNEIWSTRYKRIVQSISYIPHFISMVIVCGLITQFCYYNGAINDVIEFFGGTRSSLLQNSKNFHTIYVASEIWQNIGWGTIIYLAALSGIDTELYEAAAIDGAGKLRQAIHVTLPGILPIITIQLILRMGNLLSVGSEKILLLYNPTTYETADVIATYVYRRGLLENDFSYSTAVNMFNSLINVVLLLSTNWLSKKMSDISMF